MCVGMFDGVDGRERKRKINEDKNCYKKIVKIE